MKFHYQSKNFLDVSFYTKHHVHHVQVILEIIEEFDPKVFVELGTFQGGFTAILHERFPNLRIFSFDKEDQKVKSSLRVFNLDLVTFFIEDIFELRSLGVFNILEFFRDKRKVLYCDNGNKEREIEMFSDCLNTGDLLGVHDWKSEVNPLKVAKFLVGFTLFGSIEDYISAGLISRFWVKDKEILKK